jgi:signal transduction histidine kinase
MSGARRGRGGSLVWPVAGAILLATIVGGLGQILVVMAVLRPLELRDQRARGEIALAAVQRAVSALPAAPDSAALQPLLEEARHEAELRAALVFRDPSGREVWNRPEVSRFMLRLPPEDGRRGRRFAARADEGSPDPGDAPPRRARRMPRDRDEGPGRGMRLETIASRTLTHGGAAIGEAQVVRPRGPGRSLFRPPSGEALMLSVPIALLTALVTAFLMVRWLVGRLQRLEGLATRVAGGDLAARVEDPGGDEIGRLGERLNDMTVALAAARERLEAQDAQRRQLFADITHELATPLTSVRGYTETLLDPAVRVSDDERARYLGGILEESRRLDRLIRDLFDLARLEAGAAPLERERLDWAALCRNVVARFAPRFEAAGLALRWEDGAREAWIDADGHRIEQVIENLLANALRHVPAGGTVRVAVIESPAADGARGHRLTVTDDGPGVPEADLPHLFERFFRSAAARRSDAGTEAAGSGLGLAIVREITQRHGGAVRARAAVPRGLAIDVDLPATG